MARSCSQRWDRIKNVVAFQDLLFDVTGKVLVGLGMGALLAQYLQPYAWGLIVVGLALSVMAKAKYWKRFWA